MAHRTLLIGTPTGAFKAELNGGEAQIETLGLQSAGGLRCPLVIDCQQPRTLFAGTGVTSLRILV